MARKRPAVVTVMGILNIVLGSLFLLCNLCGGVMLLVFLGTSAQGGGPFPGGVNPIADMWAFMGREVPAFPAVSIGELVLNFILCACLIISGIGLLNMRGWARVLALIYSVITIL